MREQRLHDPSEAILAQALSALSAQAREVDPTATITGRVKSLESTREKMHVKQLAAEQVLDFIGVRVIVAEPEDCYRLAAHLQGRFLTMVGEYDDYIRSPKQNGYRSLHISLLASAGHPVEVQIRTAAMHETAERGEAAHWRYKAKAHVGAATDASSRCLASLSFELTYSLHRSDGGAPRLPECGATKRVQQRKEVALVTAEQLATLVAPARHEKCLAGQTQANRCRGTVCQRRKNGIE